MAASIEQLSHCRILVIEFHNLQRLFAASHFEYMAAVFLRLLSKYQVVHIHPNNSGKLYAREEIVIPSIMEFTFHRRDRLLLHDTRVAAPSYPHPLDTDCAPGRPTLILPQIWRPDF